MKRHSIFLTHQCGCGWWADGVGYTRILKRRTEYYCLSLRVENVASLREEIERDRTRVCVRAFSIISFIYTELSLFHIRIKYFAVGKIRELYTVSLCYRVVCVK